MYEVSHVNVKVEGQFFIYCLNIASTRVNFTRVKSHFHNPTVKVRPLACIRSKRCRKHYPYYSHSYKSRRVTI